MNNYSVVMVGTQRWNFISFPSPPCSLKTPGYGRRIHGLRVGRFWVLVRRRSEYLALFVKPADAQECHVTKPRVGGAHPGGWDAGLWSVHEQKERKGGERPRQSWMGGGDGPERSRRRRMETGVARQGKPVFAALLSSISFFGLSSEESVELVGTWDKRRRRYATRRSTCYRKVVHFNGSFVSYDARDRIYLHLIQARAAGSVPIHQSIAIIPSRPPLDGHQRVLHWNYISLLLPFFLFFFLFSSND